MIIQAFVVMTIYAKNANYVKRLVIMTWVFLDFTILKTGGHAVCINCGQCIQACPFNAIRAVSDIERVENALDDPSKIVVFNTAPAVRVAIGDAFGYEKGTFLEGKLVSSIKALGANYVFRC